MQLRNAEGQAGPAQKIPGPAPCGGKRPGTAPESGKRPGRLLPMLAALLLFFSAVPSPAAAFGASGTAATFGASGSTDAPAAAGVGSVPIAATGIAPAVTILFTHDMHSHFLPVRATVDGVSREIGGYARLATQIERERRADPEALLLDAGDFSMGTLFQTIFTEEAPELRLMGAMGYDAVTLGNHEFDYRSQGLAAMLQKALASGDPLPAFVAANVDRGGTAGEAADVQNDAEHTNGTPVERSVRALREALDDVGTRDYIIIERYGLRIGVFGITGYDAIESAPMNEIGFLDPIERAKEVVAAMQSEEDPDLIVCLSHSGTWDDPEVSEDRLLAKEIPAIDVIVSGHTHTRQAAPLQVGSTLIVSAGEYAGFLGKLTVVLAGDSGWLVVAFELLPIDASIPEEPSIAAMVDGFLEKVETGYLDRFGLSYGQVVANAPFSFTEFGSFAKTQEEDPLGSLIADSYIHAVEAAEGDRYVPVDVAVVPAGVIRSSIAAGPVTVADAFRISSLGIGGDGSPGYPLISVYLTGRELASIAEVDASVTPIMESAQLYASGLAYSFNPNRLLFNKVTWVELVRPDGSRLAPEPDTLYRVVTGLYSGQMLGAVKGKTYGLISLEPKDAAGRPIDDFEAHIIKDGDGNEVKEWLALTGYLASFQKGGDGTPVIPAQYQMLQGRKIVDDSKEFGDLITAPNHVYYLLVGAVSAVLLLLILALYGIRRHRRRRQAGQR